MAPTDHHPPNTGKSSILLGQSYHARETESPFEQQDSEAAVGLYGWEKAGMGSLAWEHFERVQSSRQAGSAAGLELGCVASHPHDFRSYDAGSKIESSLLHMSHSRSSPQPLPTQRRNARTPYRRACQSPWQFFFPPTSAERARSKMPMQREIRDARSGISIGMLLLVVMCTHGFVASSSHS